MVYSRAGILDLFFDLWERDNPLQLHVLKLFHFVFLFLFFHILLLSFMNGGLVSLLHIIHLFPRYIYNPGQTISEQLRKWGAKTHLI